MSEVFALQYIPQRVRERGFARYRMGFQDLQFAPGEAQEITAYNELWLLLEADAGITIQSDYGRYDARSEKLSENIHEHADQIWIRNTSDTSQKVQFIQVILQQA